MRYLVHHMLFESAARGPERSGLVSPQVTLSYGNWSRRVTSLALRLRELGLERGDRVGVYLSPAEPLPTALLAISAAGGVFVPIHHRLFPHQVAHILRDCGARGLITDAGRWQAIHEVIPELDDLQWATIEGDFDVSESVATHRLEPLCEGADGELPELAIERDLAAILYTSGSTGRPKGVMLSHANVLAGAEIVADYLSIHADDRILAALPFSFDAGLNQLTTAVLQGATTVMIDFRFGREIVTKLKEERITGLAGVPSLWSLLVQPSSGLGKQPLPELRYITNTGGALPANVLSQLRGQLPETEIFLMYGLTEAFRSTYLPPDQLDVRPSSIGKAIPNTEIFVLNEAGQECEPGEIGELVHHGPTVSLGYWGHPELTDRVLRPHPFPGPGGARPERVCYSGDLVRRDEEGFLYFVGRRDNQIKSSGFRVSPTEVEEVICKAGPIRQAAVIGVPHDVLGQQIIGFAVPTEGAQPDAAELVRGCAAALPRHMVPKQIQLVAELPMTASGKVDYTALKANWNAQSPASV